MSFNEEELLKIKQATSGFFKKSARISIALSLSVMKKKVQTANEMEEAEKEAEFMKLMNLATQSRHLALQSGANSYVHSEWAAASACESWAHELIGGEAEGIKRVQVLVDELINRVG